MRRSSLGRSSGRVMPGLARRDVLSRTCCGSRALSSTHWCMCIYVHHLAAARAAPCALVAIDTILIVKRYRGSARAAVD